MIVSVQASKTPEKHAKTRWLVPCTRQMGTGSWDGVFARVDPFDQCSCHRLQPYQPAAELAMATGDFVV